MMMRFKLVGLACLVSAAFGVVALTVRAEEWEKSSSFYEDDAWYDITEWMDGNDYNPVDEQWGKLDDDVYDSDAPSLDRDNDRTYGYSGTSQNDWFYDYWNPSYTYYYSPLTDASFTYYDRVYNYVDSNNDGLYDAYIARYDYDNDGDYDSIASYDLGSSKSKQQAAKGNQSSQGKDQSQAGKSKDSKSGGPNGKRHQLTGKIVNKKMLDVRGAKHVVVQLQQQDNQKVAVDLGRESALQGMKIEKDSQITVAGPMTQAGDKKVVLAQSITIDGKQHQVDRQARKFTGKVVDTRETKVRGQKRRLVVLKLDSGKQRLIDLGPSDRVKNVDFKKDSQLTLRGIPFVMQDRPLILAQSIEKDGKQIQIDRRPAEQASGG